MDAPAELVGTYFAGKFRVDALVDVDSESAVYLAMDSILERILALKVLWSFDGDESALMRLQREAMVLARIEHNNTRRIHEAGRDPESGLPYLAMEWIPGQVLEQLISRPLSMSQFLRLAKDITAGLAYAHQQGVFHGGLNPENILITTLSDGSLCARLLKFGAADLEAYQAAMHQADEKADPQVLAYLSPEQLKGEPADLRSDIYSVGVLLYQLICGVLPFRGKPQEIVDGHLNRKVPRPRPRIGFEIPFLLEALLRRCLEKNPDARFQDSRELNLVFSNFLREGADLSRENIHAVTVDSSTRYVVIGRVNGKVEVRSAKTGAQIVVIQAHEGAVKTLLFRPDSDEFLSAGEDGHINLWCAADGTRKGSWPGMRGALYALAFSPFGYIFASGEIDGRVRLWSLVEEGPLGEFQAHGGPVTALHFLPEGRFLASGGRDGKVHLWDIGSMELAETCPWQRGAVVALTMRVRDHFIVSFEDGSIAMGRWNRNEPQWHNQVHQHAAMQIFQQDGGQGIVTVGLDGVVNSVDAFDGDLRRPPLWLLEGIHAAVLHPRTETLFCSSDALLMRWRWSAGCDDPVLEGVLTPNGSGWEGV